MSKFIRSILFVLLVAMYFCTIAPAQADVPRTMSFQGLLLDDNDNPLPGSVNLTIRLFDQASAGTQLFTEDHSGVALDNGVYAIQIGAPSLPGGIPDSVVAGNDVWLEVVVDGNTLTTRIEITSVLHALKARMAEKLVVPGTATDAVTVDGAGDVSVTGDVVAAKFIGDGSMLTNLSIDMHSLDSADGSVADALFVDNAGNVGLGTNSPAGPFHILCADCTDPVLDQSSENANGADIVMSVSQTFTAGVDGAFARIDFRNTIGAGNAAILNIYAGAGTGGNLLRTEDVVFGTNGTFTEYGIMSTISLVNGQQYTFEFTSESAFAPSVDDSNSYAGGDSSLPGNDLIFRTWVIPAVTTLIADDAGNIGIGTASPTEALDVVGNIRADKFLGDGSMLTGIADADADAGNELNTTLELNGTSLELTDAGGTLSTDLSGFIDDGDWSVDGDDIYRDLGNVGIGTDSPGERLHVIDTATVEREVIAKFQTSDAPADYFSIENNDTIDNTFGPMLRGHHESTPDSPGIMIQGSTSAASDTGTGPMIRLSASRDFVAPVVNRDLLSVKNHQDEVFRIDNAGNVGIGTPTPDEALDVVGNAKATKFIGDGSMLTGIDWGAITGIPADVDTDNTDDLTTGNFAGALDAVYVNEGQAPAAGDITGSYSAGLTVGADSVALATDTTGNYVATVNGDAQVGVSGSGSEDAAVSLSINTNSLDFAHLKNVLDLDAATEVNLGASNLTIDLDSSGEFIIADGGVATHVFAANGNVGIGTASPESRLHIANTIATIPNGPTATGIHLGADGAGAPTIQLYSPEVGSIIDFTDGAGEDADWRIIAGASNLSLGATITANGIHIDTAGNIGVGTTTPTEKLTVAGTIESTTGGIKFPDGSVMSSAAGSGGVSPAFSVYRDGPQTISTSGWEKVKWTLEEFDSNNNFLHDTDDSGGAEESRFTPNVPGRYILTATVTFDEIDNGRWANMSIYKNGQNFKQGVSIGNGISTDYRISATAVVDANGTSDYFEIWVQNSDLVSRDIGYEAGTGQLSTFFSGARIDGGGKIESALSPPSSPTATPSTGGSLPSGTHFFKITALNANGETTPSTEVSATVDGGSTNAIQVTWGDVPGATGYRVYHGTSSDGQDEYFTDADGSPYDYTSDAAGTANTPPVVNTTGIDLTVLGSQTIGGSQIVTNDFSADTTTLVVDAANNRVGIGTDAPEDVLTVAGDVGVAGDINSSGLVNGRDMDADGIKLDTIATNAADTTDDSWTGTTDVSVTTGNVGIGTASPESRLHIANTIGTIPNGPTVTGIHMGADGAGAPTIQLYSPEVGSVIDFTDGAGEDADWRIIAGASNLSLGATITANGINIDTAGNIGIGTDAPESLLHLRREGAVELTMDRIDGSSNSLNINMRKARGSVGALTQVNSGDSVGGLRMWGHDGSAYRSIAGIRAVVEDGVTTGIVPGRLELSTTDATGASLERLRITSDGNVGIGIGAPSAKFEVAGNAKITGDIHVTGEFQVDGGITGELGIGTNDPMAALHLNGSTAVTFKTPILLSEIHNGDGTYTTELNGSDSVFVSGTTAYVYAANGGHFTIFDVSNPASPVLQSHVFNDGGTFDKLGNAGGVFVSGTTAYVTSSGFSSLTIIDVSDPVSPGLLAVASDEDGMFQKLLTPQSVYVSGTTAYVTSSSDSSLTIIDVSTPSSPQLLAEVTDGDVGFTKLDGAYSVHVSDTTAYVASFNDNSLTIIDVSDLLGSGPQPLAEVTDEVGGFTKLEGANSVYVSGTTAYVTSWSDHSLTIIDVSDLMGAGPQLLAEVTDEVGGFTKLEGANSVFVSGTTAYVTSSVEHSLTIIDVSNPSSPQLLAELYDDDGTFSQLAGAVQVYVSGTTAYVPSGTDNSLTIMDIGNYVDLIAENHVGIGTTTPSEALELGSGGNVLVAAGNVMIDRLFAPTGVSAIPATGGSLQTGVHFFKVSAVNNNGESLPSLEVTTFVDGSTNTAVQVLWTDVPGATKYYVYHSTSTSNFQEFFVDSDGSPYLYSSDAAGTQGAPATINTTGGNLIVAGDATVNEDLFVFGRIGAGTTSPDVALHVEGSKPDIRISSTDVVATGDKIGEIQFEGNGGSSMDIGATIRARTDSTWGSSSPTTLEFYTQDQSAGTGLNAPRMVIDSEGEVGIGTDSPETTIDMQSTSPVLRLRDSDNGGGDASSALIEFGQTEGGVWDRTGFIGDASSGDRNLHIAADSGYNIQMSAGGQSTVTDPHFVIKSDGNVGIDTSSPDAKLEVTSYSPSVDPFQVNTQTGLTLDQSNTSHNSSHNSGDRWQSFTAGSTAELGKVTVISGTDNSGTMTIYQGEGTGGAVLATEGYGNLNVSAETEIVLSSPPVLTSGITYTIRMNSIQWLENHGATNPYPLGRNDEDGTHDYYFKTFLFTPSVAFEVRGDGNTWHYGTLVNSSDRRLKENIVRINHALDKVLDMNGYYFNRISKSDDREIGLIAQEVQAIVPELVSTIDDENGYLGVSYQGVGPLLVEALKELHAKHDAELAARDTIIASQGEALSAVNTRMADMEQSMKRLEELLALKLEIDAARALSATGENDEVPNDK